MNICHSGKNSYSLTPNECSKICGFLNLFSKYAKAIEFSYNPWELIS